MKYNFLFGFLVILMITPVTSSIHLPPQLSSPSDVVYIVGETGNEISWTASAHESQDDPTVYIITLDGEILVDHNEESWSDNTPILVNVDGLAVGNYTYEIEVRDSGYPDQANAAFDEVIVAVFNEGDLTGTPTTPEETSSVSFPEATDGGFLSFFTINMVILTIIPIVAIKFLKNRE